MTSLNKKNTLEHSFVKKSMNYFLSWREEPGYFRVLTPIDTLMYHIEEVVYTNLKETFVLTNKTTLESEKYSIQYIPILSTDTPDLNKNKNIIILMGSEDTESYEIIKDLLEKCFHAVTDLYFAVFFVYIENEYIEITYKI